MPAELTILGESPPLHVTAMWVSHVGIQRIPGRNRTPAARTLAEPAGRAGPHMDHLKSHEYWRDTNTRRVWAVELTDGIVTASRGPLGPHEINVDYLEGLEYSSADAERIESAREQFELVSEPELLMLSAESD